MKLYHGDCLEVMAGMPDRSVDAIITDPPYGTTACKWDAVIPFEPMWEQLKRIIKPRGAVVLFGSEPFASQLRISNIKMYKYDWIWKRSKVSGFMQAKRKPLNIIENILVFTQGSMAANYGVHGTYLPQGTTCIEKDLFYSGYRQQFGKRRPKAYTQKTTNYPTQLLEHQSEQKTLHPTQKPVPLLEYLIKTYTHPGETVLDFTMGSGTTGVAAVNTGREFIGIERDPEYYTLADRRILDALITRVTTTAGTVPIV